MKPLFVFLFLIGGSAFAQDQGAALASDAVSKVQTIAVPLIALAIAVLALTIALCVMAYINSRAPTS
jgi:hypothetical protein